MTWNLKECRERAERLLGIGVHTPAQMDRRALLDLLDKVLALARFDHCHHVAGGPGGDYMCPSYDDGARPCECGVTALLEEIRA